MQNYERHLTITKLKGWALIALIGLLSSSCAPESARSASSSTSVEPPRILALCIDTDNDRQCTSQDDPLVGIPVTVTHPDSPDTETETDKNGQVKLGIYKESDGYMVNYVIIEQKMGLCLYITSTIEIDGTLFTSIIFDSCGIQSG